MNLPHFQDSYSYPNNGSVVNFYPTSPSLSAYQDHSPHEQLVLSGPNQLSPTSPISRASGLVQSPFQVISDSSLLPEITRDVVVSISTAFHPNGEPLPDTVLVSSEGVFFYVNTSTILDKCPSAFRSFLSTPILSSNSRNTNIQLDIPSVELNIILHALYGTSPAANSPDFETLIRAIDHMPAYSILPETVIHVSSPLHALLLSHAPLHPLKAYALAAHHKLHSMAVSVSSHLLSYDLGSISDEMAERIGATYLKKLLLLHVGRFSSLKTIFLHPPRPHPPTKQCGFENQKNLTRAWALISAYLAWDARPDLFTHRIHAVLDPLMEDVQCSVCHKSLEERIRDVVVQWTSVKVSDF